jgi:hypothetical protein
LPLREALFVTAPKKQPSSVVQSHGAFSYQLNRQSMPASLIQKTGQAARRARISKEALINSKIASEATLQAAFNASKLSENSESLRNLGESERDETRCQPRGYRYLTDPSDTSF